MPGGPPAGTVLCQRDQLSDKAALGLSFGSGKDLLQIFLTSWQGQVYAYLNQCPHAFTPLNWQPDRFFNIDKTALLCATHGAEFRVDDGVCTIGPCRGKSLIPVAIDITPDNIVSA